MFRRVTLDRIKTKKKKKSGLTGGSLDKRKIKTDAEKSLVYLNLVRHYNDNCSN